MTRTTPDNPPEMDDTPSQPSDSPRKINLPVSEMGQERDRITPSEVGVKMNSPMTEASLSLLGAGSSYKGSC